MFTKNILRKLFDQNIKITHDHFQALTEETISRFHNPKALENLQNSNLVPSAILVPIILSPEPKILLTKRPEKLKDHAGQISFPGGKIETFDESPIETAIRETYEEVGIERKDVTVIGNLDVYITGTGYRIMPIVSVVNVRHAIKLSSLEVEEIFYLPLNYLLDEKNHHKESASYTKNGIKFDYDYYVITYGNYRIWGATAGMLINLYEILREKKNK